MGSDGGGNIDADPLFADPANGDYHLKSPAGRWTGSGWAHDGVTSPCIDAGDPGSSYASEPSPNGGRINQGAYGNTEQASKSGWLGVTVDKTEWWIENGALQTSNVPCITTRPPAADTRFVVENTGTMDELFALRILDQDKGNAEWTAASAVSGRAPAAYVLSALFCGADDTPVAESFNQGTSEDVVKTGDPQLATDTNFAYTGGGANGAAVPAGASRYLWFRLDLPTMPSTKSAQHEIVVEVSCQAP
jgi:hypothetical protein